MMPSNTRPLLSALSWFAFAVLVSCAGCDSAATGNSDARAPRGDRPLFVVCSTAQIADAVRNVGREHVKVVGLMGAGVDPHSYVPKPRDVSQLNDADIIFYSGLHLEGRMADMFEEMSKKRPVFAVTDDVRLNDPERLIRTSTFAGHFDPHVWFDARLWASCVAGVAEKLAELDPVHKQEYENNAKAYVAELHDLDQYCREALSTVPKQQRVLVTAHDAFGYFGRAYDLEVHGIRGISSAEAADLGQINKLVDMLVERKIKALFVESHVPPENVRTLVDECRRRGHEVRIGGELYSDAMGAEGTLEGTYLGMMHHNVKVIVDALK